MHHEQSRTRMWVTAVCMSLAGVAIGFADRAGTLTSSRTILQDLMSPGRILLLSIRQPASLQSPAENASTQTVDSQVLLAELRTSEQQRRQLIIENARLSHQLKTEFSHQKVIRSLTGDVDMADGASELLELVRQDSLSARVIRHGGLDGRLRDLMIDAGSNAGITRSEIVVDGPGLLVEKGHHQHVAAGDRVLTGAVVVGRIAQAGRWVSLVQPVTDSEFKSRAQIMRRTDDGAFYGAEGFIEGTESGICRMTGVPYTESVAVGDHVVTAEVDGTESLRLYFGQITEARFLNGGQWEIEVKPEITELTPLTEVRIIRTKIQEPAP
ncbi:MAG: rod shape-determining protein MreC [Planctomyces sp.]|nr:rod shape-determining protein MreC [Planctomyces sp.]